MKDYELFEEIVQRLLDAKLLTVNELMERRLLFASIRKKLYPSRGRGRPPKYPSDKLMAARIEAVRQTTGDALTKTELFELVAAYASERLATTVKPSGIREIYRRFGGDESADWFRENHRRYRDRVPDLLPNEDDIKRCGWGK